MFDVIESSRTISQKISNLLTAKISSNIKSYCFESFGDAYGNNFQSQKSLRYNNPYNDIICKIIL